MKTKSIILVFVSLLFILTSGKVLGAEDLSIRILGPDTVKPGEVITYTIIYLNEGDTRANNVEITQSLPLGNYTYVSSSPQGTYSSSTNSIAWTKTTPGMSHLASLGSGARTIHVTIRAGVQGGTPGFASGFSPAGYYINPSTVTLSSSVTIKSDINPGTTSTTINTVVTQDCSALLNIAEGKIKSSTGTPVVYLIQVINSGNIYNQFDLSAINYQCGTLQFDPLYWRFLDINGNVISQTDWIAPGQSFLVLFEVSCPGGSNPGKYSCHTVYANSVVCNTTSAVEHTQTEIVPSPKEAMVLLSKVGSNDNVQSGDTLIYTIYAFNSNDNYAANNFSITDALPSNVTYISHEVIQTVSTLVSNSYNPALRTLNLGFSSLAYGTNNAITVNVYTIVNSLSGTCSGNFSNTASGTYTDATAPIITTKATTISNSPDLKITKTATPLPFPAEPTGSITYTLIYENIGNCTATNIEIADYYDNIHTTDGGSNTGIKTFGPFALNAGEKDTVSYTVSILGISEFPDGTTTILNVASISCDEPESDYNNNTSTAAVYVEILPDLTVSKTVNSEPGNILEVGKNYTYTIIVFNNGDINANNIIISDTIPYGLTVISASNGGVQIGNAITWPIISTLSPGAADTVTCTVGVAINCEAIGSITNVAYASSSTNDSNEDNNIAYSTSEVKDVELPTITCATPAATYAADNGVSTYTVPGIALNPIDTADNCNITNLINNFNNTATLQNAIFPLGNTIVLWTVTDGSSNIATCSQTITVIDTQIPIISCPSAFTINTNNACTYIGSIGTATATDNCTTTDNITITNDAPAAFPLGATTVTWTAEDESNNSSTCTQIVTVIDNENPVAICKDFTVNLSANGTATITAANINNNSSDNCGIQSMTVSPSTFGCSDIGTHTVTLTVTDNAGNYSTCSSTVTVNDPSAPSLSINDIQVTEGVDAQAIFTISMTNSRTCDISFTVNTANNSALSGSDYTAIFSQIYTIPAGQTSITVNVPIINNTFTEPTETYYVNLSNPIYATLSDAEGVGTILDNDAASVAINDMSVNESGGIATFTVTLTGNIQNTLTVDYATSNGTALSGTDYTITNGTLTFPAGSVSGTTKTFTIDIINDLISEPTETYNITLSNLVSSGFSSISDATGIGTILDNDAASVAINDMSVNESVGTATFTVTLTGNIQDALTVDYATSNGTALTGSDYTATNGTLTFLVGSVSGTTKTFTVTILNDLISEPTETYNITLSNLVSSGSSSITDATGIGTILDNDAASVAINDMSVNESAGTATFTVTLTGNIQNVLTVDYATSNGTALSGTDYTITNGTLTFPAGSVSGTTKTFTVAILNDLISEPTETYNITLSNLVSSGSSSISDATGIGTILDNDAASVAINDMSVNESVGTATFTVTLTGNIQDALTVDYATSNGTALTGSDYTATNGTLTFLAGSVSGTTKTFTVAIINDLNSEPTETYNVTLGNLVSSGLASITDVTGIGTILDNDAASVAINDMSVNESAGTATFTVTLTGNIQDVLTVDYTTSDGTALTGTDYIATNGTLTFLAGSVSGTTKTFSVSILNNLISEPIETYNVTLSNLVNSGSASITDATGLGTILDNDIASITINNETVSELDGSATFIVTLTGNIQDALTIDYVTTDGTAEAGNDYTTASGTVTFPAASISGATQTITITILTDVIAEATETYNVNLSNILSSGTATINDNLGIGSIIDENEVSVIINDVTVSESDGTATFTVSLIGNIASPLTVDYTTSDVTALAGSDYTTTNGTITFPNPSSNGATQTITVPIINNFITEPTETFNVNLSNIVFAGSSSISDNLGIGTINDDAINDAVSIAINDVTLDETDGTAVFTVTLTGNIQDAFSVDYSTSDVTALAGTDYTTTIGTLTFPANSINGATLTITVPILNNLITEPTETFEVNLSNIITTGNASISDNLGVGTITDDAINDAVSIAINDVTVDETDGTAVFTVTLTGNIQDALTVDYSTSDVTALAGTDYTTTIGTLTFPANSINGTTQSITVPILNNLITEPTETFDVNLSNIISTGDASISDNLGVGTINDDAINDAVSIAINDVTVDETDGTAVFTVTLTGNIQDALTVDYSTSDVTALAGTDYTTTIGTLTFPANSIDGATLTITVPILNNLITEPTETFDVNLSNIISTGDASITDNLGVGTINDDAINDAVSIAINDVTIDEPDGNAVFTVTLTGNIQDALTVDYSTSDVTALAGTDYTTTIGTLIFPANSINGATLTITVPIINNLITEPTETFEVNLSNIITTGNASITDNLGVGTITDDAINDAVSIAINDVTVDETDGNAVFTVTLTGNIQDALTVDYSTSDVTALAGTDYTTTIGTLTFPANSINGTTLTITVPIIDNLITEPTESFNVNLSNIITTGNASISDNLGIGTINDDAINDAVSIAINDVTVDETDGNAVFTITLTGNIQDALSVDYSTSDVTALAGKDYIAIIGTVIFPANSVNGAIQTITIPIINNMITEPTETFNVNLSNIVNTGDASISDNLGVGTITDDAINDAVSIAINDVTVSESVNTAVFTVTLTGNIQDALSVDYSTSDVTAHNVSDYLTTNGTLTFPANSVSGATLTITIPIINNMISEPTETFNVNLTNIVNTGSASISDNLGICTITDDIINDAASIAIDDIIVSESASTATFTVTLTGNIQDALSVDFITSDGTAITGNDYMATNRTITFPANSANGAMQTISIPIINNLLTEPTETYNITLSNIVSIDDASISDAIGLGTILDNDVVNATINDVTVIETAGTTVFTVTLIGSIQDALTLDYTTSDGTALAGSDYTTTNGTLTFLAGSISGTTQTISVPIINNLITEPTETFNVNLSNILSTGGATITDAIGIGTITDDAAIDAVSVAINDVTFVESAGTATFTVTLTGNIQDALTVNYATSNGTATSGTDYTASTGIVTFPAGSISGTTKNILITFVNDGITEPTEAYNVTLSNIICTGNASISDNLGIGTITDDDVASIAINDISVSETDGTAILTVTLTGNIQDALTVDYATSDGTALTDSDYNETNGTLTFPAKSINGTTQTIIVTILNDVIAEPTETFNATLSNLVNSGVITISDNLGVGTINDDDIYTIDLTGFITTETNAIQTQNFVATMNGVAQQNVIVTFNTSNGTATSGSDYTLQNTVNYTIPAGSTVVNIPIDVMGDLISEPTEIFNGTIEINNANGQQISINTGVATGTILDDDIADLVVTKVSNPAIVAAGQNITYTLTVDNLGTNLAQNVVVNDVLPIGLTLVSATTLTGTWSAPNWTIGTLTSGSSATLSIIATVNADVSNGTVLNNTAIVTSTTTDPDNTNNTATTANTINVETDLAITKTIQTTPIVMGQEIQYQIIATNNGPSDALGVTVNDTPNGISNIEYSTDNGTSWLPWTDSYSIGTIVNGGSITFLLKGNVNINQCNSFNNTATITCPNLNDPDLLNNSSTISATPEDNTLPIITCPTAISVVANPISCTASDVNLGIPTTNDNCTITSVTNNASTVVLLGNTPETWEFALGSTTLIWTVADQSGNVATCNQTITVISAPEANVDYVNTNEDTPIEIIVLANDTECTNNINIASVTVTELPSNGTISENPLTGTITYTPNPNYNGPDSLIYQICNNGPSGLCDTAIVYINIISINDAPIAVTRDTTTLENIPVTLNATIGAIDIDGTIDVSSVDLDTDTPGQQTTKTTTKGVWTVDEYGNVTFTPELNYTGIALTYYTLRDNEGELSNVAQISVFVMNDTTLDWKLIIPEGFSPNDDGVNDIFEIENIDKFPNNSIVIFNRWGNIVYKAKPYPNTWGGETSFGIKIGGNEMPVGTYFYIIDLGDGSDVIKGFIYINR